MTKGPSDESPSKLAALAPRELAVVMSSEAWEAYDVPGAPYFVYVDGESGEIHGEGAALAWDQVASLLTDALYDSELARGQAPRPTGAESTYERAVRADGALAAAGIPADDPSFHTLPPRPVGDSVARKPPPGEGVS